MSTSTENIPKVSESGARASDDLLEIARATGLRQHMHGVNATDAQLILQRFVGALRFLRADGDAPEVRPTVPEAIRTMAERIAADKFDHCTADPIFTDQKRELLSGLDLDYCEDIGWFNDGDQVLGEEAAELEAEFQDSGAVPDGYTRTGIMETWEHYATYITPESAEEFVAKKGDQYRVYVDSGCRNHEWKALRAFLKDVAAAPTPPTVNAQPIAWAIRYSLSADIECLDYHGHNAIADYLDAHPDATVTPIYAAPTPPTSAADADLLASLARVADDFEDCGETEVTGRELAAMAQRGWLDCTRYVVTPQGHAAIAAGKDPI